jgi:hypothetical protein
MRTTDRRHLEHEVLQLQRHPEYLLHRLRHIDEVLYLAGYLQRLVQLLPVGRQLHVARQHPDEVDRHSVLSSCRSVLEGVSQETLLLELLDQRGVHVQVDGGVVAGKVHLELAENLTFEGNRVEDETQVGVVLEIADVTNKQTPRYLTRKLVVRNVQFLQRRVHRKYHILLEGLGRCIVDEVVRKVQIKNCRR